MAEPQDNTSTGGNPTNPVAPVARSKTSNDDLFAKFLVHPLTSFDETNFIDLLEHSLSLSTFEKKRVIDAIPTLSQFQIDELIKVFEDERVEFRKLMPTEWDIIKWLVVKAQNEWEQLKDIYIEEEKANAKASEDAKKAEELKKSLWI